MKFITLISECSTNTSDIWEVLAMKEIKNKNKNSTRKENWRLWKRRWSLNTKKILEKLIRFTEKKLTERNTYSSSVSGFAIKLTLDDLSLCPLVLLVLLSTSSKKLQFAVDSDYHRDS